MNKFIYLFILFFSLLSTHLIAKENTMILKLKYGEVEIKLYPEKAPNHVARFKKFSPGPGVGGHCIPIDPLFMKWIAKKKGHEAKFIDLGIKTNKNVLIVWLALQLLLLLG